MRAALACAWQSASWAAMRDRQRTIDALCFPFIPNNPSIPYIITLSHLFLPYPTNILPLSIISILPSIPYTATLSPSVLVSVRVCPGHGSPCFPCLCFPCFPCFPFLPAFLPVFARLCIPCLYVLACVPPFLPPSLPPSLYPSIPQKKTVLCYIMKGTFFSFPFCLVVKKIESCKPLYHNTFLPSLASCTRFFLSFFACYCYILSILSIYSLLCAIVTSAQTLIK